MFGVETSGSFDKTLKTLERLRSNWIFPILKRYGQTGVSALSAATPRESSKTANSWGYTVFGSGGRYGINWHNSNINGGVNIAVILQYGHGTGTGGYVEGIDYINPAMRPVFERMVADIWRQVING